MTRSSGVTVVPAGTGACSRARGGGREREGGKGRGGEEGEEWSKGEVVRGLKAWVKPFG